MIRWGFIGCGTVVERKSGKPFWLEGKSDVVAVMCRNLDSAKDFAQRHNIAEYYDDADQIICNPNVDAVYIATTHSTHIPYAKRVLEAGKPVYIEKPMGVSVAECEELMALAEKKNLPVFVAYYRRSLPYFHGIKKMLDDGVIGTVRSVNMVQLTPAPTDLEVTWRRDPALSGGGLFHDLGCHALNIMDFLIAPISEVSGQSANQRKLFPSDDTVSCQFRFENGVVGTGLWCFDVSETLDQTQIIGDKGCLEFAIVGNQVDIIKEGKRERVEFQHPAFIQEKLIHNIIHVLHGEAEPLSTGEAALRTVRVMEQITG